MTIRSVTQVNQYTLQYYLYKGLAALTKNQIQIFHMCYRSKYFKRSHIPITMNVLANTFLKNDELASIE